MKDCLTAQDVLAGRSIKHACYGGFGGLRAILGGRNDGGIVVSQPGSQFQLESGQIRTL